MSPNYYKRRQLRQREKSLAGVLAKARKRMEQKEYLRDVGGIQTDGVLGRHVIRLMSWPDEDRHYAIVLDGQHCRARTMRGVVRVLTHMVLGTW